MVKVNLARIISEFILHYVSVSEPKKTLSQAKLAKLLRSGLLILSVIMVMLLTIIRH